VSNPLSARTARRIAQDRVRLTMLDAAGVKPSDIGRVFNRAAPTAPPTPDDIERITVPESGPELEMMLGDGKTMAKVFTNKDTAAQFLSNYARVVLNKDQSIATQVREETQRVVADYLREQGAETDRIDMRSLPAQTTPARGRPRTTPRPWAPRSTRNLRIPRSSFTRSRPASCSTTMPPDRRACPVYGTRSARTHRLTVGS
jgi:hypothetical protein